MFTPLRRTDPDFFTFDWQDILINERQGGKLYATGQFVRPSIVNGFYAECTTAGLTADTEPGWLTTAAATVQDGSVVWTMRAPSSVTLATISAAVYTITPTGITQSGPTITGTVTRVKLDASAANLGTYTLLAEITAGSEDYSTSGYLSVID